MKKTILAVLLAGATWVTGCGSSNNFDAISGQPGNPTPIITPTPTTGYFVDATSGNDATGSFNTGAPYATVQAAANAAPTGSTITVRPGTYAGDITLKDGQRLLGVASGTRPVLTGGITLASGNTIDFLNFQGNDDNAITADNDVNGGTVTNCVFADTTNFGNGLRALSVTGTWVVEANTMTNLAGIGVEIAAESGDTVVAQVNNNVITGSEFCAIGFGAAGGDMRVQSNDNVMTGNGTNFTYEVVTDFDSDFVAQIVGNTNDDVYRLSRNVTTSNLRIERLSQLTTLNSGGATVLQSGGSQPPEDVANGAAGFGTATP